MKLTSSTFLADEFIPAKYSCDGENINPPLTISDIPANTKSIALIVDDPDAPNGDWIHWLVFNINPETKSIPENSFPANSILGKTSSGNNQYSGPCPPSGIHHYHFKLYALDNILTLDQSATKDNLLAAMENHLLDQTELIGLYQRK